MRFEYSARLERIVDGDSNYLLLDRGFSDRSIKGFRLMGVDTPEVNRGTKLERTAGKVASQFVVDWMAEAVEAEPREEWPLYCRVIKRSKYGDFLVRIWRRSDDAELNRMLLDGGLARLYLGKKKTPWSEAELTAITAGTAPVH